MISFNNYRVKFKLPNDKKIAAWLEKSALKEKAEIAELNYIFCSDKHLHKINLQFLNHDTLTDIITFDYCSDFPQEKNKKTIAGDIFISINRVKENARAFNTTFENELSRVLVHGLLHLLGYKDKKPADKKLMTSKENFYLNFY